jgi:uncharacterized protein YodC (DUF2158 family)
MTSELTFKPGDLVKLRSGGAVMVVRYNVDQRASEATGLQIGVHCDWHVSGRPQLVCYLEHELERVQS